MKQLTRLYCVGTLLFVCSSVIAEERHFIQLKHYAGIDVQQRGVEFKRNAGASLVANKLPQLNLYTGAKFNDYVGMEFGYQASTRERKDNAIYEPDSDFGLPVEPSGIPNVAGIDTINTKIKMQGLHFDLVGFMPITKETQMIGSVGLAVLSVKLTRQLVGNEAGLLAPEDIEPQNFFARRAIPRFSLGFQHQFSKTYGIRGTVGYEGTIKFKNLRAPGTERIASLKNSVIYSLGVFISF